MTGTFAASVVLTMCGVSALGQTVPAPDKTTAPVEKPSHRVSMCELPGSCTLKTFYLANSSQVSDANEVVTALRNMLPPEVKIYLVPSQNVVLIQANAETLAQAKTLIDELDHPKKVYRLTYTITEMDARKPVGTQHFAMVAANGQRVTMKEGSKVPVATGSLTTGGSGAQTQFTYLDVGMNFDATPSETATGAQLKTKVEQSSIAEEKSGVGAQDPVVRQTVLESTSFVTLGKPLMLGSLDIPGSTRHLDVEVMMEMVK